VTAQDVRPVTGPADETPRDALAHNYHPLPVTVATAEGSWVTDVHGRRYLDFLAGYSALNFGHRHPALVAAATAQLGRVTLTSRAFDHDLLHPFASALAALVGPLTTGGPDSLVLPMNTGAEAVETAIKTARKWGYDAKGVRPGEATIVVGSGNFHGRTTTIVSFSDDDDARRGFDPYTPGFRLVPYGDADAVAAAIDDTTVAVLLEPVQGESGVVVPPADYWPRLRALTAERDVLLIADEIQAWLGRAGTTLAVETWGVRPDLVTLGKALGGGILPVSAVVGRRDVLAVLELLATGEPQRRARELGARFHERLAGFVGAGLLDDVRGLGLWAGLDLDPARGTGRDLCEALLARGVLAKDTHGSTIRLAPPLTISADDLETGLSALEDALTGLARGR
jgi:ornithine--oxo-acid transaminase